MSGLLHCAAAWPADPSAPASGGATPPPARRPALARRARLTKAALTNYSSPPPLSPTHPTDAERFSRSGIKLVLNSRVKGVELDSVTVVDKDGGESSIPFGACVWATGIAMHPVVKLLAGGPRERQRAGAPHCIPLAGWLAAPLPLLRQEHPVRALSTSCSLLPLLPSHPPADKLPEGTQSHFRSAVTDEHLRVKGSNGTIFALGDAATIEQAKARAGCRAGSGGWHAVPCRAVLRRAMPVLPAIQLYPPPLTLNTSFRAASNPLLTARTGGGEGERAV